MNIDLEQLKQAALHERSAPKLEPVDFDCCQAEKPNGKNFMSFGGQHQMVRCNAKPDFVITERKPGKDGQCGSMSLCIECCKKAFEQLTINDYALEPILRSHGELTKEKANG
jgi:hypothetical protein